MAAILFKDTSAEYPIYFLTALYAFIITPYRRWAHCATESVIRAVVKLGKLGLIMRRRKKIQFLKLGSNQHVAIYDRKKLAINSIILRKQRYVKYYYLTVEKCINSILKRN